jgi:hypothetical protein
LTKGMKMSNHRITASLLLFVLMMTESFAYAEGSASTESALPEVVVAEPQATVVRTPTRTQPETTTQLQAFTRTAVDNMKRVFQIGSEVGHPETLQAILLRETKGGQSDPIGNRGAAASKRSYGLMQVQVVAARSVLQRNPQVAKVYFPHKPYDKVTNDEIVALLLNNDEANIRIAAMHFKLYFDLCNGNWDKAVAAYNMGIGNVEHLRSPAQYAYVVGVRSLITKQVQPFNKKHGLLSQRI